MAPGLSAGRAGTQLCIGGAASLPWPQSFSRGVKPRLFTPRSFGIAASFEADVYVWLCILRGVVQGWSPKSPDPLRWLQSA